ncbi:hypothetical protein [Edaphobacter aggregans]|uniref:hypothetical protein n=1 Tax=Edaphobacter aggregans TaxID=570835 RepID=UPI0005533F5A|nr:hypothetical protein [Edaphobacter aggregans]
MAAGILGTESIVWAGLRQYYGAGEPIGASFIFSRHCIAQAAFFVYCPTKNSNRNSSSEDNMTQQQTSLFDSH